jgi:hypothetical protein
MQHRGSGVDALSKRSCRSTAWGPMIRFLARAFGRETWLIFMRDG